MYSINLLYAFMFGISAVVTGAVAATLFRYRSRPEAYWLFWFMISLLFWTVTRLVIMIRRSVGPPQPELLAESGLIPLDMALPHVGGAAMSIFLLLFTLEYTGNEHLATRTTALGLSLVSVLSLLALLTNDAHYLFWTEMTRIPTGDGWYTPNGPIGWVYIVYHYLIVLSAVGLLTWWAVRTRDVYRGQSIAIVAGVLVLLVTNSISLWTLDLTPISFVFTGICLWVAMYRYRLSEVIPIARSTVMDQIEEGVVVIDRDEQVVDYNDAARQLLDLPESSIGRPARECFATMDGFEFDDQMLEERETEATIQTGSGERIIDIKEAPLYDERGSLVGQTVLLRDVTEERTWRRQIEQQNEQLEQFAQVVSHDLRNPLNVATLHLSSVKEGSTESIDEVERSLNRMEAIIEDVLTLASQGKSISDTESVSLRARAEEAWGNVDTAEASVHIDCDRWIDADPERLLQLFENLFRNAVEHGGEDVTVTVGADESSFYVADDGPGIPDDERDSVLESGYSTAEEGTGFGLAIVEQIAQAHGWTVTVTESPAGGAQFEIHGL